MVTDPPNAVFLGLEQGHSADRDQWRQEIGTGNLLTCAPLLQGKSFNPNLERFYSKGSRIAQRGRQLQRERRPIILTIFPWKLHEIEKKLNRGGEDMSIAPPFGGSANILLHIYLIIVGFDMFEYFS